MPKLRGLLIDKGTSFDNFYISLPQCCPSRASILTGLYTHNHNVQGNLPPLGGFQKFYDEGLEGSTVAVRLQEAGYRTVLFGKYLNGYPGDEGPSYVPPGWDEWYGRLNENVLYGYKINENGQVVSYDNNTEDYYTDVLSKQVTDFVHRTASDSEPFFMYVAPSAPHAPATPAERHKDAFADEKVPRSPSFNEEDVSDKPPWIRNIASLSNKEISEIDDYYRQRLRSMLAVDEMVASLVQELKDAGKLDNTYIFFTSDNGWEQGQHRIPKEKGRPYEESSRVPLYVRGPGVSAGSKTDKLLVNTDFAPTFADLAGTSFPSDGRSFKPLLEGEESSWRSAILLERLEESSENGEKKKENIESVGDYHPYEAVRSGSYKYIEYANGERELYDLEADPSELDNIYESADPSLVEDLKARLDALKSCSGTGCQEAEDPSLIESLKAKLDALLGS
jgi:arylsulfatase A-like enzyme